MLKLSAVGKMKFLSPREEKALLQSLETKMSGKHLAKYRLLILLMLDAGCRVTEACSMKLYQIQPAKKLINVKSLKKRGKNVYREVPMTQRLLDALADYWAYVKSRDPEAYLFPSQIATTGHASRKVIWRVVKNLTGNTHPHVLRHTFCTKLATRGNDAFTIKELAGHDNTATTEIYIHASKNAKQNAIASIDQNGWWARMYRKLTPRRRVDIMPVMVGGLQIHIGRKEEITRIIDLAQKKVNILITGEQGMGKTHLTTNLTDNGRLGKVLRIDDMTAIKATLAGMVLTLFNGDKDKIKDLLYGTDTDVEKIISKESIKRLCELLIRTTTKHEYTIVIDDATRITPMGISTLEKLNDHFHMIIAARSIKLSQVSFLSNFEKVELSGLSRAETIELITRGSQDFTDRIEDWEMYKGHVWRATNGNPKFILELIERFRREPYVSAEMVQKITHTTALKEVDMSLPVVIALSSLMILRYVGGEVGTDAGAFRLIGGAFLVFALFARSILRFGTRRYV
ncbi:tyrosine-type recombinase/integrase [Neolewinella agarilytica]|uniref:Phage integrase family protein n=1 Tax=Neolewinella agarilytica TaxID=478744 RepID=A0A1H9H7V7_9BACT|nr:tyrosine-type recombinase/integrase [Neolewinella agarilytica]SEQ58402.1 Phage integrase family protein [Neolewinella agarilytica]